LAGGKVWQVPATAVKQYKGKQNKGGQKRPKRGWPVNPASKRSMARKALNN
jgi:hypothetical protein